MKEETLLLNRVKPSKVKSCNDHFYEVEFVGINDFVYTVFVDKFNAKQNNFDFNNYFDLIKVDVYRNGEEKDFFEIAPFLQHQGIYSFLTIVPNHIDPAKFHMNFGK